MTPPRTIAGRTVARACRVAGGSINDAFRAELEGGGRAFVKTRAGAPPEEFREEAAALAWLADGGARVPEVLEVGDGFLALVWLEPGPLDAAGEEELGRMLATLHRSGAPWFGRRPAADGARDTPPSGAPAPGRPAGAGDAAPGDASPAGTADAGNDAPKPPAASAPVLRIGPLALPDAPADDWPTFYAERRLLPLLPRAGLSPAGARAVEDVCARMAELAGPPEPPARLHGDLWSGNVHASGGRPYLIDPAAYGGHREVDLAMLRLFGSPSARTLAAYEEVWPLADGHEERVALWQLFPLLVHAVLFGGSYAAAVERAAARYARRHSPRRSG